MNKIGVSTQLLAGGDIYPALEKGVIDATEFSMPTHDLSYGFYQLAKFNYFPGWHQQTSIGELLMKKIGKGYQSTSKRLLIVQHVEIQCGGLLLDQMQSKYLLCVS